jgi:uncharacterized membrane protein YgcG
MSQALPYLVGVLLALLLVFFIYSAAVTTWLLAHSEYFSRGQKLAQVAIIWLLPVIGIAIVLSMLGPEERKRRPGWVPLLEPFILSTFIESSSGGTEEASHDSATSESLSSHDGGGDGGGH